MPKQVPKALARNVRPPSAWQESYGKHSFNYIYFSCTVFIPMDSPRPTTYKWRHVIHRTTRMWSHNWHRPSFISKVIQQQRWRFDVRIRTVFKIHSLATQFSPLGTVIQGWLVTTGYSSNTVRLFGNEPQAGPGWSTPPAVYTSSLPLFTLILSAIYTLLVSRGYPSTDQWEDKGDVSIPLGSLW